MRRKNRLNATTGQSIGTPGQADYEAGNVPICFSGWPLSQPAKPFPSLESDLEADVVVIGAGLAGSSLALHLAECGVDTVLLEAGQPGNGASGRNAGHVQPYLPSFAPLKAHADGGRRFIDFCVENRNIVFELCGKYGIEADAVRSGMVDAARKRSPELERKARLWQSYGYNVETVASQPLKQMLGTDCYRYGLHWREGGRVNPYLFTNGMATAAAALGTRIYGDSAVVACEREGQRWRVRSAHGSVLARRVVICTNGHAGNPFFADLQRTQYPLVACGLATRPLPQAVLDIVNPARVALAQYPSGLYPLVIDGRNRLVTATIPGPGRAQQASTYFDYFLRYLHRTFPEIRGERIELESYWTGMTANASSVYDECYPKLYDVADGVLALMNFGSWGNVMGPLMGMNLAQAICDDRPQDCLLPLEKAKAVRFPGLFETKIRRVLIPMARIADRFSLV